MTSKPPTRERILDAATDMFGVRGVDAVSLDMIAADVGVAKQTLLYWFPSKDDLVQAVAGLGCCLLALLLVEGPSVGWSAAYGAGAVLLPTALLARGMTR